MNQKGFSLIEVLVGVAILTSMSVMIYSSMGGILGGKQKAEKRDELLHTARVGLARMTQDISQAFLAKKALEGQDGRFKTGLKGSESELHFSTMAHPHFIKDKKETNHIAVGYKIEKTDNGLSQLIRRSTDFLKEDVDKGGKSYVVLENVKELEFSYYDSNKGDWVKEWKTTGVSKLGRLPQAVKIKLNLAQLEDEDSQEIAREMIFTTVATIEMYQSQLDF